MLGFSDGGDEVEGGGGGGGGVVKIKVRDEGKGREVIERKN